MSEINKNKIDTLKNKDENLVSKSDDLLELIDRNRNFIEIHRIDESSKNDN